MIVLVLLLTAAAPGLLAPYDPNEQFLLDNRQPPLSPGYVLGTDQLGRDVLSRVIYGARTSLAIGLSASVIAAVAGVTLGLVAGYRGGATDNLVMRAADVQLTFPFILLAIAIIGVLGASVRNVIAVTGIANWVYYARVVRSESLSVRERDYVQAARALGASTARLLARHILPNVAASIIVVFTFGVANAIVAEAGLSFLGMGVPVAIPSWGGMLADGRGYVDTLWWLALFPGLAIVLSVLGINLLGDFLRDVLDPHMTHRMGLEQ